jgi:tRNA A37 methylthiotransferase MiaB
MAGAMPVAVRRARAKELDAISAVQRKAFAASFLGRNVEVCIERGNTGWTAEYLKCTFADTAAKLQRRSLAQGRVIGVEGDSLVADI